MTSPASLSLSTKTFPFLDPLDPVTFSPPPPERFQTLDPLQNTLFFTDFFNKIKPDVDSSPVLSTETGIERAKIRRKCIDLQSKASIEKEKIKRDWIDLQQKMAEAAVAEKTDREFAKKQAAQLLGQKTDTSVRNEVFGWIPPQLSQT